MPTKLPTFLPLVLLFGACSYVTEEEGRIIKDDLIRLKAATVRLDKQSGDLKKTTEDLDAEVKKMRSLVDEATKIVTHNSADLGLTVQKLQVELASATGRIDDIQNTLQALGKNFTEYRAQSDVKIEQVVNATSGQKIPIPDTADAVFSEAQRRYDAKQWPEARRLYEAFVTRYPQDSRAAKAQYLTGESYLKENRYASAIGAFTKLIDNYPKSEMVPDAMFRNGTAFYALKYCNDARIYFQELIKRYPKTEWKKDANDQLRKLQRDLKNKAACSS